MASIPDKTYNFLESLYPKVATDYQDKFIHFEDKKYPHFFYNVAKIRRFFSKPED